MISGGEPITATTAALIGGGSTLASGILSPLIGSAKGGAKAPAAKSAMPSSAPPSLTPSAPKTLNLQKPQAAPRASFALEQLKGGQNV